MNDTDKQTVLVTGGAGYIGSHTCKALHAAGFLPVVVDDLSSGLKERVKWGPLEVADIRDADAMAGILQQYKPVAVLHFAAKISVAESVENPKLYEDVNVRGSEVVFSQALQAGVKHVVFSSTAAVYGSPTEMPVSETVSVNFESPYGQGKYAAEQILRHICESFCGTYAVLRYFNAAGADKEHDILPPLESENVIAKILATCAGGQPKFSLFGTDLPTEDGTAVRDFIHVTDLAHAHIAVLKKLLAGDESMTLNLGTGEGMSLKQLLKAAEAVTDIPFDVFEKPARAGDIAVSIADVSQAKALLGWQPEHSDIKNILATHWHWWQKAKQNKV